MSQQQWLMVAEWELAQQQNCFSGLECHPHVRLDRNCHKRTKEEIIHPPTLTSCGCVQLYISLRNTSLLEIYPVSLQWRQTICFIFQAFFYTVNKMTPGVNKNLYFSFFVRFSNNHSLSFSCPFDPYSPIPPQALLWWIHLQWILPVITYNLHAPLRSK